MTAEDQLKTEVEDLLSELESHYYDAIIKLVEKAAKYIKVDAHHTPMILLEHDLNVFIKTELLIERYTAQAIRDAIAACIDLVFILFPAQWLADFKLRLDVNDIDTYKTAFGKSDRYYQRHCVGWYEDKSNQLFAVDLPMLYINSGTVKGEGKIVDIDRYRWLELGFAPPVSMWQIRGTIMCCDHYNKSYINGW
jgi:hypothetical protein